MTRVPFTYTWTEPGILIGSIPQLPEDYQTLRNMGIEAILTLTRRNPQTYEGMPAWSDVEWLHVPIPDNGIGGELDMRFAAHFIGHAYDLHKPVYIHCRGGIGRSGMILIAYYVLGRGMTVAQARDMVRLRRNWQGNACAADQGSPQREWIDALEVRS